ncbi:MAG: LCP family protein [Nocardioides sp.]|uniref:LCP family protein n=1 Tax=Nocardioides sp. TaxID=35761 RepID=UPI0039E53B75
MSDEPRVDDPAVDSTPPNKNGPAENGLTENGGGAPKRRGKPKKRHTVARVLTVTIVVMSMAVALFVVYSFRHLSGNLTVGPDINSIPDRPKKVITGPQGPLNILVMGDDTRSGKGNHIDNEAGGGGSDTTILLHLSADRKRAYGISIPRDTMVDRPACDDGKIPAATYQQWNAAYALGGPLCTIHQLESLTDIRIDHYVVVKFAGFKGMVDAIGGVEVCVPEEIDDPVAHIHFDKGTYKVTGDQALSYVRVRHGVGNGSDIGRTRRQQAFIASMANQVISAGTLTRPDRVLRFLNAATKSLQVDEGLSNLGKIAALGYEFRHINPSDIQFITIPWMADPNDPNRVVFAPEAQQVWKKLRNDQPLTKQLTSTAINAGKPPGSTQSSSPGSSGTGRPNQSQSPSSSPSDSAANEELASVGLCTS